MGPPKDVEAQFQKRAKDFGGATFTAMVSCCKVLREGPMSYALRRQPRVTAMRINRTSPRLQDWHGAQAPRCGASSRVSAAPCRRAIACTITSPEPLPCVPWAGPRWHLTRARSAAGIAGAAVLHPQFDAAGHSAPSGINAPARRGVLTALSSLGCAANAQGLGQPGGPAAVPFGCARGRQAQVNATRLRARRCIGERWRTSASQSTATRGDTAAALAS